MNPFVANVCLLTVWSFGVTTALLFVLGAWECRSPFPPVNAISHMFFGAESYGINRPLPKFFVTGLALNFAAMASWAVVLELGYRFFRVGPGQVVPTVLMALALTVVAYIVDYHIVPKRFTPGFEHVLSVRGLALTYAGLALSLVAGGLGRVVG